MCGILGIFGSSLSPIELRALLIESSRLLRHRGPDWSGYIVRNMIASAPYTTHWLTDDA